MNISTELFQNSTNELTVTTGYGDQYVKFGLIIMMI